MFHPPKNEELEHAMAIAHTLGVRDPFLLHVGAIEPRKNLVRVLEACFSLFHADWGDIPQLVLCGRRGWRASELDGAIAAILMA